MKKLLLGVGMVMMAATSFAQATDHLELIPAKNLMEAEVDETVEVTIKLAHVSDTLYSGFQCDIWVPEGLSMVTTKVGRQNKYFVAYTGGDFTFDGYSYNEGKMSQPERYGGNEGEFYRLAGYVSDPNSTYFPYDEELTELFTFKVKKTADFNTDICPVYARLVEFTSQIKSITNRGLDNEEITPDTDSDGKVVVTTSVFPESKYLAYKVGEKGYSTLCINDALDFTDSGLSANVCSGTDNGYVQVVEIAKPEAGTPLIIKGTAGAYELKANYGENDAKLSNLLVGTPDAPATVSGNQTYALASKNEGVGFYRCAEGVVIPQYKAYIVGSTSAESFLFEETTGIQQVQAAAAADGSIYTLTGSKVNTATQKGVYIMDGKKVVVK